MLKNLRDQESINLFGRKVFELNKKALANLNAFFTNRWRLSGIIELEVNDVLLKMVSKCDDHIVDEIYYQKENEKFELALFATYASNARVIFDIGANTGIYSLLAAKANPGSKTLAFEPNTPNFQRLKLNLEVNNIQTVEALNKGVGAEHGILHLTVPSDGKLSTVSSFNGGFTRTFHTDEVKYVEVPVEVVVLNDWCDTLNRVDLVKIDVETFEMEVFKGGYDFFEKFKPLIFCEVFVDEDRKTFFDDFLNRLGYTFYSIVPEGLIRLDKLENNGTRNFIFSQKISDNRFIHKNAAAALHQLF